MGSVHLVRHGHAAGHDAADPGLSQTGRDQVEALARRLGGTSFDAVWHGSRRRAAESARVLAARLDVERCEESDLLADRTPVPSAGREGDYPAHRAAWLAQAPPDERDPDGVGLGAAWSTIREHATREDLLLVTHAFVVGWFVREVLQAPPAAWLQLPVANTGLTVIRWNAHGEARVETVNDTGHLPA